jgi:hypothetical protein
MKHYTEKVRQGILLIEANMEIFASDKRDEGDKERADAVDAALAWIGAHERKSKQCSMAGCKNTALDSGVRSVCAKHDPGR